MAPLLTSGESKYSTFWMSDEEDDDGSSYFPIYNRKEIGCFKAIGVRECYLMDLDDEQINGLLNVENNADYDDDDSWISNFAKEYGILLHVCNRETYGYLPDKVEDILDNKYESFIHLRIEHLLKGPNKTYNSPLPITKHIDQTKQKKKKSKLGFDQIYVINLERRADRRDVISSTLDDLNIAYKIVKAVDGKSMDDEYIKSLGIKVLPDYKDPYNDRSMNYGEIGCFLSHYFIWKEVIKNYLFFIY